MTERQGWTFVVWVISLAFIGFGIWGLGYEYSYWRVSSVTVSELANQQPSSGNFRITDGVLDYANAVDSNANDGAYVPVRSRSNPNAPISVVLSLPSEQTAAVKKHPNNIELLGHVWGSADDLPKSKRGYAPNVVEFSPDVLTPYGPKLTGDILFAFGSILLGTIFILMNAGLGKGSFRLRRAK